MMLTYPAILFNNRYRPGLLYHLPGPSSQSGDTTKRCRCPQCLASAELDIRHDESENISSLRVTSKGIVKVL